MDKEEPKQLKLTNRAEDGSKEKKEKKEKEPKGNKIMVIVILVVSVLISFVFLLSGIRKAGTSIEPSGQQNQFGGAKIYQF